MSTKITVIGAGNVGATCANILAVRNVAAEVVLLDIKEGVSEGKSMDIMQSVTMLGINSHVKGVTDDYAATADSEVVIVTSGIPRKPGMTREELIGDNAVIVKSVVEKTLQYSPATIFIIVSNPMDSMCYLTAMISGLPRTHIIGLGGALDSARFKYYLSEVMHVNPNDIEAIVIGGHSDATMVPLVSLATCKGIPVTRMLPEEKLEKIVAATKVGGATLTGLLGTSAWYAPGAAAAIIAESIVKDRKRMIPCGVFVQGEYGQNDLAIGVPVVVGKEGWEQIVELPLSEDENHAFIASANATRKVNQILIDSGML